MLRKPDSQMLEEYLVKAHALIQNKFKPKVTRNFTKRVLEEQIYGVDLDSVDCVLPNGQSLQTVKGYELQEMILQKKISYEDLVNKFHKKKQELGNPHNAMIWSFYDEPLKLARECDKILQQVESHEDFLQEKPLTGYVLSIKDSIYVKDCPSTCGIFINLDRVPTEDPHLLKSLKKQGAVITSRGNIPQFLLSMESNNYIYGLTTHPLDETRTAGGSSGGEGVMVASGIVTAAIGTDTAGSVRIPSLFLGLYGFKPTTHRVSSSANAMMFERYFGSDRYPCSVKNEAELQMMIAPEFGPLTRCVEDIDKIMAGMVADQRFDPLIPPLPWRLKPSFKKRLGVFRKTAFFEPCASSTRALDETISRLSKQGYEFVELDIDDLVQDLIYWGLVVYNKSPYIWDAVTGRTWIREKIFPMYEVSRKAHSAPLWLLRLVKYFKGVTRESKMMQGFFDAKTQNLLNVKLGFSNLYKKLNSKLDDANLSGILSIGLPLPAIKMMSSNHVFFCCCYLFIYNFMRMPAGVCPVTTVREDEQFYESKHDDEMTRQCKITMEGSKGLPIGVQIAARTYDDEIVVAVMRDIEKAFPEPCK